MAQLDIDVTFAPGQFRWGYYCGPPYTGPENANTYTVQQSFVVSPTSDAISGRPLGWVWRYDNDYLTALFYLSCTTNEFVIQGPDLYICTNETPNGSGCGAGGYWGNIFNVNPKGSSCYTWPTDNYKVGPWKFPLNSTDPCDPQSEGSSLCCRKGSRSFDWMAGYYMSTLYQQYYGKLGTVTWTIL
jgi:hypothetical protein